MAKRSTKTKRKMKLARRAKKRAPDKIHGRKPTLVIIDDPINDPIHLQNQNIIIIDEARTFTEEDKANWGKLKSHED